MSGIEKLLRIPSALRAYQKRLGAATGSFWYLITRADRLGLWPRQSFRLQPKVLRHPVVVRMNGSSDTDVFNQIFLYGDVDFARDLPSHAAPKTILDLGANVGYVSAYLLNHFPDATLIAVEPDPANAAACEVNLRPYGERAQVLRGAVWTQTAELVVSRGTFGDGREWATEVREAKPGESPDVTAWSMDALLDLLPKQRVDLMKIDIEGSELAIFSAAQESWLDRVSNICIEIHGSDAYSAVVNALRHYTYQHARSGEYDLFLDIKRAPAQ